MKITGRRSKLLLALLSICFLCALSCESGSQSMKGLLPDADEVMGWRKDGERLIYLPENLWEYINGAAEGFLVYEFEKVVVQDYLSINDTGLKVEIYKHASPLMAFGIYSQFRGPGLTYVDVGTEGFGDEYSLQFFQGSYYVKINVFERRDRLVESMMEFARHISAGIVTDPGFPRETACFPEKGLVDKSIMYVTEGVLGRAKFPPAFIARYTFAKEEGKLFIFPLEEKRAAGELFDWYAGEIEGAIEERDIDGLPVRLAHGEEKYRGSILVFDYGRWVGVVTGFENPEKLESTLVGGSLKKMKKLDSARGEG